MPTSLAEELPTMRGRDGKTISPLAGLVLRVVLENSNSDYKNATPGQSSIIARTGIRTRNAIRKFFLDLEHNRVLYVLHQTCEIKPKVFMTRNVYCFTFEEWINKDRARGIAGRGSDLKEKKLPLVTDSEILHSQNEKDFDWQGLPKYLHVWQHHLMPLGKFQSHWYFQAKTEMSNSFVEEKFKKAGISVKIIKKAS